MLRRYNIHCIVSKIQTFYADRGEEHTMPRSFQLIDTSL